MTSPIGQPLDRVDGRRKVTGEATFTAERQLPRLCHAAIVFSTEPSGLTTSFDLSAASGVHGVIAILTPRNAPRLPDGGRAAVNPPAGRVLSLLQDDTVSYTGQPIAVVVAESLEEAQQARALIRVRYAKAPATLDFASGRDRAYPPADNGKTHPDTDRGDWRGAFEAADVRVEQTYSTPMEHHNPLEPHATVARWDGDRLTVFDSTQYVSGVRNTLAKVLGIPPEHIHVISPFVGGGFGCKGSMWSHVALAAMAARKVGRPVKLALDRTEMFGPVGGRPQTEQRIALGAKRDGTLVAISHSALSHTSFLEDFTEPSSVATRMLYACPNVHTSQRLIKLNVGTPTFQRAPGESTGTFALEVAMDELAAELGLDPVELRLRNYAEVEPESGKPWSSKSLRECYRQAGERFGWAKRPPPRQMRHGNDWVGWGMATATYPVNRMKAAASARYLPDGSAVVRSGSQELGTGTYTVMSQVASDALGIPVSKVKFELGDSTLPTAPVSGGSMTVASVSPAVRLACEKARDELIRRSLAAPDSALSGLSADSVAVESDWIYSRSDPAKRVRVASITSGEAKPIEATAETAPGDDRQRFAMHSFGAVFAEVRVDAELAQIRVPRIVATYGVGRLLNAKTGTSQLVGGIVWGIGMALLEDSHLDVATGRVTNANLAEYHVPSHADIGVIDVTVVEEEDQRVNSLGAKGIGEIGITGVAGALSNAIFHATGHRLRRLPMTLDQVLGAPQGELRAGPPPRRPARASV